MPLPTIAPYPMPAPAELPAGPLGWTLDPDRSALLIHDMQRYFVDAFPAGAQPRTKLVANIAAIRRAGAGAGAPVLYTAQPAAMSSSERGLLRDLWGEGMALVPGGAEILPELEPEPRDVVLTKWRYSAFHKSDLEERLRAAGRDHLVICGVYAHLGILMTAVDAFSRDIRPFLVADAVADFTPAKHRLALGYAAESCARVLPAAEVLTALREPAVPTAELAVMTGEPA